MALIYHFNVDLGLAQSKSSKIAFVFLKQKENCCKMVYNTLSIKADFH